MRKLALLLALLVVSQGVQAAVTEVGTRFSCVNSADETDNVLACSGTVAAGADLLVCWAGTRGTENISGASWNTSEAMSEIVNHDDPGGSSDDVEFSVFALINPTATTSSVSIGFDGSSNASNYYFGHCRGYDGVVTSSIDDATDVDTPVFSEEEDGVTIVLPGFGAAGNAVVAFGVKGGADSDPGSMSDGDYTDVTSIDTGGGANNTSDAGFYVGQILEADGAEGGTLTMSGGDDPRGGVQIEINALSSSGEFDTTPSVTDEDTTEFTVTGSLDAAGDVYGVACLKDQTAPTISQVEAGDCTGDVDAEAADSDSPSTGGFDFSLTLTPGTAYPVFDIYVTDGTNLTTLTDEFLDPPSTCGAGDDELCQFILISSIGAGSPCDRFNTDYDPDIAANDVLIAPTEVSPGGLSPDDILLIGADCQFEYTGDDSRQGAVDIGIYDTSAEDYHAEDIDFWDHDVPIDCDDDIAILIFDEDGNPSSVDLDDDCTDESQPTYAVTDGTLHTGLTLTGGTGVISFSYSTEDEEGDQITFTATGEAGDTDTLIRDVYVVDTYTAPTITGFDYQDADDIILNVAEWYGNNLSITFEFTCHESVAKDVVITQTPTASAEVDDELQAWSATVSTGECPTSTIQRRPCIGVGLACRN